MPVETDETGAPAPAVPDSSSSAAPESDSNGSEAAPATSQRVESPPPVPPRRPSSISPARAEGASSRSSSVASLSPRASSASASNSPKSAFRSQLQSIRTSDLDAEHTLWTHAYAAEETFWLKQEERYNLLLKRAQVGAASSRDLHLYLRRVGKLLVSLSEQLQTLGSFGQQGETGTMRGACMAVDIVRKTTASYLGELNARVFGESIRQAGQAAEEAAKLEKSVEQAGADMIKAIKTQRRATNEAWMMYRKLGEERSRAEASGIKVKSDPFLLARVYETELYQLQTVETKFGQLMASLLKDVESEEAKRLAVMKLVLIDNLTAQKAVLESGMTMTDNALQTVKAVQPEVDLQEFMTAADLYLPSSALPSTVNPATNAAIASVASASPLPASHQDSLLHAHAQTERAAAALATNTPVMAFLAPPPSRDPNSLARVYAHEIDKEGPLFRQGSVFKSNWKPMHAILTSSGFLHLFEEKGRNKVHSTWNLSDATLESGESVHPLAFSFRFTRSGFSLSGSTQIVHFKAANVDELMEWRHHAQKHVLRTENPTNPQTNGDEAQQPNPESA